MAEEKYKPIDINKFGVKFYSQKDMEAMAADKKAKTSKKEEKKE